MIITLFSIITSLLFLGYLANVLIGCFNLQLFTLGAVGEFLLLFFASTSLAILCLLLEERHHHSQRK